MITVCCLVDDSFNLGLPYPANSNGSGNVGNLGNNKEVQSYWFVVLSPWKCIVKQIGQRTQDQNVLGSSPTASVGKTCYLNIKIDLRPGKDTWWKEKLSQLIKLYLIC